MMDGGGLDDLFEQIGGQFKRAFKRHQEARVIERIPMRPEWEALFKDMREARLVTEAAIRKAKSLHRQFWAKVEADTKEYRDMRISDNDKLIEVLSDDDGPFSSGGGLQDQ